jgi:hypothetical protein
MSQEKVTRSTIQEDVRHITMYILITLSKSKNPWKGKIIALLNQINQLNHGKRLLHVLRKPELQYFQPHRRHLPPEFSWEIPCTGKIGNYPSFLLLTADGGAAGFNHVLATRNSSAMPAGTARFVGSEEGPGTIKPLPLFIITPAFPVRNLALYLL